MEKPTFGSIIRNNLLVVLGSAVVLGLAAKFIDDSAIFLFGFLYLGQALFNLILGFVHLGRGPEDVGATPYFLSMFLVLIIGFGACSGIFIVAGSLGDMR
jgi:multicomponent K+:H+ antiporter subunit F